MSALEAMALGTPLVAHNIGGLTDILQDYPDLLVFEHTPEGYAEKVRWLLVAPTINVTLTDAYTATRNAAETLSLYHAL